MAEASPDEVKAAVRAAELAAWRRDHRFCGTCGSPTRRREDQVAFECPACGAESIIKGKQEYGGGWICFQKKGGCGAKFTDDDQTIVGQLIGRVENPDIADAYNTVLKMSKKRAHVDAIITATAASDIFVQDEEDKDPGHIGKNGDPKPPIKQPEAKKTSGKPKTLTARGIVDDVKIFEGTAKGGKEY